MFSAVRMESMQLPPDFLDILKTDDENGDILDFPSLEWFLEENNAASTPIGVPIPESHHSGSAEAFTSNLIALPDQGPQSSSGGETGDAFGSAPSYNGGLALAPQLQHQQQQQQQQTLAATNSFARISGSADGDDYGYDGSAGDHGPLKKKRTRNAEQMQQNRVAQQKYRERKKNEQHQLQNALDQLTAQLAMMKAMEANALTLQNHNSELVDTVNQQAERINGLALQVESQAAELAASKQELTTATSLASSQQRMILDQHSRLQLQEEVITALRGRLREKMDHAFQGQDPKTVCQRMVVAVRAALEGAKNVEGLQESLAQLPDPIITDICRSILCEVKNMWPELAQKLHFLAEANKATCGAEAHVMCPTHTC